MRLPNSSLNILVVSRSFYPVNAPRSIRATELVKEFARQGHHVTLLTLKNDTYHVPFEEEYGITIKDIGPVRFPSITISANNKIMRLLQRAVKRVMNLFFEYPDIELVYRVGKALKSESGYDLMISIAVPHPVNWGVAWARDESHEIAKTWVADCGDPYYGLENDSFRAPFYFSFIEKWFCRKANFISVPFEGAKSAYFDEFHPKIRVIPQGLSFPAKKGGVSRNGVLTFAYFGNIQSYLHYAVPFLEQLNTIGKPFKFIVYTRNKDVFERTLSRETLNKCEINGYVDREELLYNLENVDFLVHFPYLNNTQKSLKLVDYYYLGKPILEYKNDEFSNKVLREFFERNYEHKREVEDYKKYDISTICNQFIGLCEQPQLAENYDAESS